MTMTARYDGRCRRCQCKVAAGSKIDWDQQSRTLTHATQADCDAAVAARPPVVVQRIDLTPIAAFLGAAKARGLKFPKLRVLDVDGVSELKLHLTTSGAAPGSVSLTAMVGGVRQWVGTVRPDGEVRGPLNERPDRQQQLLRVAADPTQAAKSYAAVMSRCCFCGLELKDDGSVEAGYGPTCADHWGLPHKAKGIRKLQPAKVTWCARVCGTCPSCLAAEAQLERDMDARDAARAAVAS